MIANPAMTFVRRWVALYTRGLAPAERDARRDEIESDLWAHADEAAAMGRTPSALDAEMLVRLVLGMPADISWRRAHRHSTGRPQPRLVLSEPASHHVLTAVGVGTAVFGIVFATVGLLQIQQNGYRDPSPDVAAASSLAVAMIVAIAIGLIGLLLVRRYPSVGRTMTLVGAGVCVLTALVLIPWMWAVILPIAVPVAVIGVVRARQVTEALARQAA